MTSTTADLSTSKGERTASRIRGAALELFSRLGFERVNLSDIAVGAGVSQPALHYHFQDKAQLWKAAMLELRTVIAEEERLLEAAADATPLAQLKMAMRLFLRISWNHPALGRIVALEGMAGGERLAWLDSHLIGPRNRRLTELVSAAIAADALKAFPPAQVVVTLQAAAAGIINLAPLMQASFGVDCDCAEARDAHERLIVDAFIGGLVKPTIGRRNRRPREGSHGATP